jgi:acetyl-CoA acetyltransferase
MAFDAKNKVAFVGVGQSRIARNQDRPMGALAVDACLAALSDAGLTVADIDGLSTFEGPADLAGSIPGVTGVPVEWMVDALGVEQVDWWATGGGNISSAIGFAIQALANDCCKYVLVWKAMRQPRARVRLDASGAGGEPLRVEGRNAYLLPYGVADATTHFAPAYMRYMQKYGARREHMAAYALTMRSNAGRNPAAIFRDRPLDFDEYMSCRMISDPLCLLDCDIPVDGAGAVVLARADLAADLKQSPAFVTAFGSGGWDWRLVPPALWASGTARNAGRTLWESTDLKPTDMDAAMLYDGFSPDIYWWLEGFDFCGEGEAFEWIQDGRIALGGELPVNTFGGQLSEGRLHGIGHWIEGIRQIQGRADDEPGDAARQVPGAENVLVATGMIGRGSAAILSKSPR